MRRAIVKPLPPLAYARTISLGAASLGPNVLWVVTKLTDPEHRVGLDLDVGTDGVVRSARLTFEGPFPTCTLAEGLSLRLIGRNVRDATRGELAKSLAAPDGCFHVYEVASAAFNFAANVLATARVGWGEMHPPHSGTQTAMEAQGLWCLAVGGSIKGRDSD